MNTELTPVEVSKGPSDEVFMTGKTGSGSVYDPTTLAQASSSKKEGPDNNVSNQRHDLVVISEKIRLPPERLRLLRTLLTNLQSDDPVLPEPLTLILGPETSTSGNTLTQCWGSLYIGSLQTATNPELLRSKNITHIVQVLDKGWPELFSPKDQELGLTYQKISLSDIPSKIQSKKLLKQLGKATDFIHHSRTVEGKNVLVHCIQGVSRSTSIVIGYLMREYRLTFKEARKVLEEKRAGVKPNLGFVEALEKWEEIGIKGFGVGPSWYARLRSWRD